ncbi:MAG: efflux RND transporter periplasmic adaptor subunit [Chthoniobacterales bacterium]
MTNPINDPQPAAPPPADADGKPPRSKAGEWLIGLLIVAALVVTGLLVSRLSQFHKLAAQTDRMLTPVYQVAHPQAGPKQTEITLPGDLAAYNDASLFSRTNGYLKEWFTDLGAKVTAGQLMAQISAPDVDAQLNQAQASLAQTQAALEIARLNFQRQQSLLEKHVASEQDYEEDRATFQSAGANVKAAQAAVDNLTVQQDFQKIIAPFPGVVTQRLVDIGDLVMAGTSSSDGSNGKPLFTLARTDILRVFINIPQAYSPSISQGMTAYLSLAEFPGRKFEGRVTNIAGALDSTTRTLLTEVQVPNADGRLFPGAYAQVHLAVPVNPVMVIPSSALIFRGDGLQVGVVDGKGVVHLAKVSLGLDFGQTVEVTEGLSPTDNIILNPPDSIAEGQHVETRTASADS